MQGIIIKLEKTADLMDWTMNSSVEININCEWPASPWVNVHGLREDIDSAIYTSN